MTKQKRVVKEVEDIVKQSGNSGRIYLPNAWAGKRVRAILVDREDLSKENKIMRVISIYIL